MIHCGQGCNKKFCSRCLLRHYGEQDRDINIETWQCPFCKKICCCAYCRRNKDKLISSTSNSLNSNAIIGNSSFGSNKNPYRKMPIYPLQKDGSLKRERDEEFLTYNEEYVDEDYEEHSAEEEEMKRQLGFPPSNRVNTNTPMHNMYAPKQHQLGGPERGGPMYFSDSPMIPSQAMMGLDGPSKLLPNLNSSSVPSLSSSGSQISVPVALRIVPVSPNTPDLLKMTAHDETSYGWNPTSQSDWMGGLFNADLDRHDQYHMSPLGLGTDFAPNSKVAYRDGPGSFAKRERDGPDGIYRDRDHPQYRGSEGLYRREGPFPYDKNGRKFNRGGPAGKKAPDFDEDYAPNDYEYGEDAEREHEAKYYHATEKERLDGLKGVPMKPHLANPHQGQYAHQGYYGHAQSYAGHGPDSFAPDHEFQSRQMDVKRSRLPAHAVSVLKEWFFKHSHSPYPTEEEKEKFTKELSLTILQVNNWFTNARRRLLPDRI